MTVSLTVYNFALAAGGVFLLPCSGSQFYITTATGTMRVDLNSGGTLKGIQAGQGYKGKPFSGLTLTDESGAANTGTITVSDDDYIDRRITGAVTFAPLSSTSFANAAATVTNASAQLLAASATRKYLLVQNNGGGDIFVTLDGTVATVANGVKLSSGGGSIELAFVVPTQAINAIGSIANNPDVLVVEA